MDEIIGRLMEARRSAKLSLQDIQERTKISLRQLEYLESFQYDKIGPPVYIKGFIRRYAQEVGIDPETLWGDEGRHTVAVTPSRAALHKRKSYRFNAAPLLRITAILVLLVVVGFLIRTAVFNFLEPNPPAPPAPPGQDEPTPGEDEDPLEEPEPEPTPVTVEQVQADDSEAIYLVHNAAALDVVLSFSDRCWTRIFANGEKVGEATFAPGHQEKLPEADVLRIRFGAPKYVTATVNGVEIEMPKLQKGFNLEIRLEQTE